MPGKYSLLEKYLRELPAGRKTITVSFGRIESIIGSRLPASANELSWWEHETEGNHVNKRAWAAAGWRVETVNLKGKWARFIRANQPSSPR